jgi:hypothetical protein
MKIYKRHLRTDKPKSDFILGCFSNSIYGEDNTYIPKWTVVPKKYYKFNKKDFEGWVELPPESWLSDSTPVKIESKGYTNCVLAYYKKPPISQYPNLNWGVSNVAFYHSHMELFKGFIELEFLIPEVDPNAKREISDEERTFLEKIFGKRG